MKKIKKLFQDKLFLFLFKCSISLLFGIIFFVCYYFCNERTYSTISTGFFIPASILIGISFFSFVNHLGGFDFVSYATITSAQYLKKNPEKPFEDLIAYKEYKNEKREFEGPIYIPYLIFGLIFLVLAIVFYVLFKKSI